MKLIKNILLCIPIMMCLVACGSATSSTSGSNEVIEKASESENKEELIDKMSVEFYSCNIDDYFYYTIITVLNNSDKVVKMDANFVAKDEGGNNVGATSANACAIAPGQSACIWSTIDYSDSISSFDYTLTVDEDKDNHSISNDVSLEHNIAENKVILTATNNGTDAAHFVLAQVLFFKDGQMVNFSEPMFTDDDFELKPGATNTQEAECYSESGFDDVKIFYSGRK